jgi:Rad3-related DNA helicase
MMPEKIDELNAIGEFIKDCGWRIGGWRSIVDGDVIFRTTIHFHTKHFMLYVFDLDPPDIHVNELSSYAIGSRIFSGTLSDPGVFDRLRKTLDHV